MTTKPKNDMQQEQERREKSRRRHFAEKRETMLRRRLGLTRKNHTLIIQGVTLRSMIGSPAILRERWIRVPYGRHFHFMLIRITFQAQDDKTYSALQLQCHDADRGYMLNVSRLYGLTPA